METKGETCKIPLDLHNRITEEIKQNESTMSKFIEQIILEHYEKGAITMGKTRTMAFQVSEELFQQIKEYLARYEQTYHRKLSQKEFVIGLIEQALEEADEEFEAAEAAAAEEAADDAEINDDIQGQLGIADRPVRRVSLSWGQRAEHAQVRLRADRQGNRGHDQPQPQPGAQRQLQHQ